VITAVKLRELLAIEIEVRPVVDIGGGRRFVPFDRGRFAGYGQLEDNQGIVLEGGVDWQTVRPDGAVEIDAHYTLETAMGEAIEVRSQGVRRMSDPVAERLAAGESVLPEEYYFRTLVRLSTAVPRLAQLNDLVAVSTGSRQEHTVHIHVHEVL
jgi:hypothetical protein